VQLSGVACGRVQVDSDEEVDDETLRSTDFLMMTARTEDDVSHLEVRSIAAVPLRG
jgi:hypothetical protein